MMRMITTLGLLLLCASVGRAQLPTCDKIYLKSYNTAPTLAIYTYDPNQPLSTANPIINTCSPPSTNSGISLAISPVLGSGDPRLTFYSIGFAGGTYMYYHPDSAKW